jgi:low affinity Fe/Cu permease
VTSGIPYAPLERMDLLVVFLALIAAAIATMPVWNYSAKWKLYPCSACLGVAAITALLVVAGLI